MLIAINCFGGVKKFGKEIKKPEEILVHPDALLIINTLSHQAVFRSMKRMHIVNDCLIVPYYFHHGVLGNPYDIERAKECLLEHKQELKKLYNVRDPHTKRYLDIIFDMREKACDDLYTSEYYSGTGENMDYFCDKDLAPRGDVTFIDVGAFCGESIEPVRRIYGERLKKCIAFEPDTDAFAGLNSYVRNNDLAGLVDIFPYALGDMNTVIKFKAAGANSMVSDDGRMQMEQRTFDGILNGEMAGDVMVKMDIEGGEMAALRGMKKMIKKYGPYMAVCLYHKEADLYDIPNYLQSLRKDYRFYLRGGWHLECWAVPEKHFVK